MDNVTEEQDLLSLHSTRQPLTTSPQNEREEQSQESQASQDQSVLTEEAAKIPTGIAAEDWDSVRREIEAYEPYLEDEEENNEDGVASIAEAMERTREKKYQQE